VKNYSRRINRLEKRACETQRQNDVTLADRVIFYLPHNHRDDVAEADASTTGMAQVILYDPEVGMPQEV
jgi:hypothetical protein